MGTGTGLGRVRGLGSARTGSHHWWNLRVTSAAAILIDTYILISLLLLPDYSYQTLFDWISSPMGAVPVALLVINWCWHTRLGLAEPIEDYVHGGARILSIAALTAWTFGIGAFALFALFRIAFTGGAA